MAIPRLNDRLGRVIDESSKVFEFVHLTVVGMICPLRWDKCLFIFRIDLFDDFLRDSISGLRSRATRSDFKLLA